MLILCWLLTALTLLSNPIRAFILAMPSLLIMITKRIQIWTLPPIMSLLSNYIALSQRSWIISWMVLHTPYTLKISASLLSLSMRPHRASNSRTYLSSHQSILGALRSPTHYTSWSLISFFYFELAILWYSLHLFFATNAQLF